MNSVYVQFLPFKIFQGCVQIPNKP